MVREMPSPIEQAASQRCLPSPVHPVDHGLNECTTRQGEGLVVSSPSKIQPNSSLGGGTHRKTRVRRDGCGELCSCRRGLPLRRGGGRFTGSARVATVSPPEAHGLTEWLSARRGGPLQRRVSRKSGSRTTAGWLPACRAGLPDCLTCRCLDGCPAAWLPATLSLGSSTSSHRASE